MKYYIGVDIGGTNIKAGVVDENAQLVSKISLKTNAADGYKSVLAVIIDAVEQAVQLSGEDIDRIKTIGVGCPGTMDNENGTVLYSNNLHWENVPLAKDLAEHFGKRIILENDANVAAYGEYLAGAAKGAKKRRSADARNGCWRRYNYKRRDIQRFKQRRRRDRSYCYRG